MSKATTAAQAYEQRAANVRKLAAQVAAEVDAYDRRRSSKPGAASNWGHAGDMEAVEAQLVEALRMLGHPAYQQA